MQLSRQYKDTLRKTILNKYDIGLLTKIALYKLGDPKRFYYSQARKKRFEDINIKVKKVLKKDIYGDRELSDDEQLKINSLAAEVIDLVEPA